LDFTFSKYQEILTVLKECGYNFYTIKEWIEDKIESGVVIRHDVDRRTLNSLKIAQLENRNNIKATFYFRIVKCSFKTDIISEIAGLGHEIGYHYEELTTHKGDYTVAIKNFSTNLEKFKKFFDVKTIAMHGKPTSKLDNRDMWRKYNLRDFGISGDAYLSIDYIDTYYFSDTGRNWKSSISKNYKDYVNSIEVNGIESTDDLIGFIKREKPQKLIVMTHPERWNDNIFDYSAYFLRDFVFGSIKKIYYYIR
jgi:hypothetical protein